MKPRAPRPKSQYPRDTDPTPFTPILDELLRRLPGALAAALVDREGETVDYSGRGDPYDMKVAAAHGRILLNEIDNLGFLGTARWLVVRGVKRTFVTRSLPDAYALVLLMKRRAGFTRSSRAFLVCERALALEAGWPVPPSKVTWHPVEVQRDRRGRPRKVGALWVEVLGAVMGLPAHESGFRVRVQDGSELTLIREARNAWYADDNVADAIVEKAT